MRVEVSLVRNGEKWQEMTSDDINVKSIAVDRRVEVPRVRNDADSLTLMLTQLWLTGAAGASKCPAVDKRIEAPRG